jgi:pimeloyl-ACP methyl ester carboxylesterase
MSDHQVPQKTIQSPDGTTIAYATFGKGPGVIMIPGALEVASEFYDLATKMASSLTVYVIERRGRGQSGSQGDNYSILTECDDVNTLQQHTGALYLFGHSYGGLIALETARTSEVFTKLALYEPGVSIDGSIPDGWMPLYREQLAQHKYLDAFTDFSLAIGPESAKKVPRWMMKMILQYMLGSSHLKQMLKLLPESLREHEEVARLDNTYKNYGEITANILLMYGGKSAKQGKGLRWVGPTMKELAKILPFSTTRKFPRLDHFGLMRKGAVEVAQATQDFFSADD